MGRSLALLVSFLRGIIQKVDVNGERSSRSTVNMGVLLACYSPLTLESASPLRISIQRMYLRMCLVGMKRVRYLSIPWNQYSILWIEIRGGKTDSRVSDVPSVGSRATGCHFSRVFQSSRVLGALSRQPSSFVLGSRGRGGLSRAKTE
ncbi:hypothetical protein EVAR_60033_1 [Eumeta japonica]|uniref:Uncharacterized protein n=1 Tax=Eumeta variegata TaxID=151549 RepID=A0A4C1ZJU5_EUMVA|nr:hypothetical protein EVAR_60011_1 [Eumeta japonica]GBP88028.1 hypothetical protein EVAR_60033_1 [Eumeta japonica]